MKIVHAVAAAGLALASSSSMAAIEIRAVPSVSNVLPGQEYAIQLLIDGDTTTPGDQPVPSGGLMSAGVAIKFDSSKASLSGLSSIVIPPGLDSDGLGGPPTRRNSPGDVGYTGFIPLGFPNYTDSLLATIFLVNNATSGSYSLRPDLFFPLADPRENFVNGQLVDIDPLITFASPAQVNVVVPEPASALWALAASVALIRRRRSI